MTRSEFLFSTVVTLVASSVAAMVGVIAGSRQRDHLTTHELTLVDARNQPIAVLSSNQGGPELALFDQQHRKRSALFLEPNGTPDLYLYDSAGQARAAFDLYDSGAPNLALDTSATGPSVTLESKTAGSVKFVFHNFRNTRAPTLGSLEFSLQENRPTLQLLDASGKRLWGVP